jgi:predicted lipid-binding transport protein (Tim44 family)
MKFLSVVVLLCSVVFTDPALAKRLANGTPVGKQSNNVTEQAQPATKPSSTANPAQTSATPNGTGLGGASPQPKPWAGMLGGLAAGLGLAWLASTLGLGDVFGQVLLIGLLLLVAMLAVRWVWQLRGSRSVGSPRMADHLALQSASGRGSGPRDYSPQNVGNDASARPWERSTTGFEASRFGDLTQPQAGGALRGSGLSGASGWGVPAGFDVGGFLQASKANFIGLQAAWDRSDIPSLRAMMTDDMLAQIKAQLAEREQHSGSATNVTEVVMLEARLLGIEELDHAYIASVEFSGMIREDVSSGPNPFREVWNITRPKAGSGGWLVAGVQALQ